MTVAQQRRYESLAAKLIFAAFAVFTIVNYFTKQGFWAANLSRTAIVVSALVYPWFLWLTYRISKGYRRAKITYVVLTFLGILLIALDYKRMAPKLFFSTAATISYIIQQVIYIGTSILLLLSLRRPTPESTLDS